MIFKLSHNTKFIYEIPSTKDNIDDPDSVATRNLILQANLLRKGGMKEHDGLN